MKHTKVWTIALVIMVLGMALAPAALADQNKNDETGSVCGIVYQDWDQDGEQDEEEPGLGDAVIMLRKLDGTVIDEFETDIDGAFCFDQLAPGAYVLSETDPMGFSSSTENDIKLIVRTGDVAEAAFGDMLLLLGGTAPSENADCASVFASAVR